MSRLKSNSVFTCDGCSKTTGWTATGWICPVYANPAKVIMVHATGQCAFNQKDIVSKKARVRVGQQKQRTLR